MRDADRLLIATFIIACVTLSAVLVMGQRWIFASSIVFGFLPLGCILIGISLNERERRALLSGKDGAPLNPDGSWSGARGGGARASSRASRRADRRARDQLDPRNDGRRRSMLK